MLTGNPRAHVSRTPAARGDTVAERVVAEADAGTAVAQPSPMVTVLLDLRVPFVGLAAGVALLAALRHPGDVSAATGSAFGRASAQEGFVAAGTVAGVVIDAHGDPVPGALVLVLDADGRAVAESQTAAGSETDGDAALGEFRIGGLPAGEYALRAVVPESESVARLSRVPVRSWEDTRVRIKMDLGY